MAKALVLLVSEVVLSRHEKLLLTKIHEKHPMRIDSLERRSDRPFDIAFSGRYLEVNCAFSAWLPLSAIYNLIEWTHYDVAELTDHPEMVEAGDWSGVRDSSEEAKWNIFEQCIAKPYRQGHSIPVKYRS